MLGAIGQLVTLTRLRRRRQRLSARHRALDSLSHDPVLSGDGRGLTRLEGLPVICLALYDVLRSNERNQPGIQTALLTLTASVGNLQRCFSATRLLVVQYPRRFRAAEDLISFPVDRSSHDPTWTTKSITRFLRESGRGNILFQKY